MSDALTEARAELERSKHQIVKTFRQPGNDYRKECRCRCGWWGFATSFPEHRARAVLAAVENSERA